MSTVGSPVISARGTIKFNDVVFSYPTRPAVNIFDGLSFEIPPGTNVAIVGSSGGGKSTISEQQSIQFCSQSVPNYFS